MADLRRALGYLRPYWLTTLGALISLLLVTAGNLLTPQVLRLIVDRGITPGDFNAILLFAGLLLGVSLLRSLFSFTQSFWAEKASQGAAYDMRNALFTQIGRLSFSYHDRAQTGQLMTRLTSDVEQTRLFIGQSFLQMINAIVMLAGSAAILLWTNWRLALIALAIVPAILVVFAFVLRRVAPRFRIVQQKLGNLNTILQENLTGMRIVKAFAREPYERQRFHAANEDLLQENLSIIGAIAFSFPLVFFIANLGTLGVIWFGGYQVIGGALTVGDLVAFNTYLSYLLFPVFILGGTLAALAQAIASAHRVFEIIDAPIEVTDRPGAVALPRVQGRVAFEDVSFKYIGSETPALDHVSFVAEPGQTVAILGRTGSGKSTVINLIPRFYDVTGGRVTIDGYDVRDVTLASLRSQIGIVLQETTLFSGTIRDNIAYGRPDATDAEVEAAARAAQAHEFIMGLPDGYQTVVGERGIGLSGGQRQRVAIARALLLDPRILILDDSTSALDAETEYQIQLALQELMKGRTSFIIAQRVSTVRNADLILLLEGGRLIAQGTYDTLLEESAEFAEILDTQFGADGRKLAEAVALP
jgi:ATP-binding cassette subfamily B multidrug efflux pump